MRQSSGILSDTFYTIAFGDDRSEVVVELKKAEIYSTFVDKLWRAVCVRLLSEMLEALKTGRNLRAGNSIIHDDGVTLVKHKFWGSGDLIKCTWDQVRIWSGNGSFCMEDKDNKKINASISYINDENAHVTEQLIRMAFKRPELRRLSELLQ